MAGRKKRKLPAGVSLRTSLRTPDGYALTVLAWSADGRRLAVLSDTCEIWEVDHEHNRFSRSSFSAGGMAGARFITFAPTDADVFACAGGGLLTLYRKGASRTYVTGWEAPVPANLGFRSAVAFSRHGTRIAVPGDGNDLRILEAATGAERSRLNLDITPLWVSWSPAGDRILAADDSSALLLRLDGSPLASLRPDHEAQIHWVAWSPDGTRVCVADADRLLRVWDATGLLLATMEGHTAKVAAVDFSHDGRLLYSLDVNGTVRCWRTDTWQGVARFAGDPQHVVGGLVAAPTRPRLALRSDGRVAIIDVDIDRLTGTDRPARTYANAKVVLTGDTGVGKSGLGLVLTGRPYAPTDSTHARQVWTFDERRVELPDGGIERREVLLWDLAGQPGYRLIHQLHLAEAAVALVVFDARSEVDPLAGARYWARALRRRAAGDAGHAMPAFLVAARADRGGLPVSRRRIDDLCAELGLAGFIETSAKEGRNIEQLAETIRAAIDWSQLPRSVSTELFEAIKRYLVGERASDRVLATADDLYRGFLRGYSGATPPDELRASFDTCVGLLELRDLVRRLPFGGFVLLRPELLDSYASALIDAARAQPDGLGFLSEEAALAGGFPIPAECRPSGAEERLLLIAMVEELLRHDVALRETTDGGVDLVFPSQLTADGPDGPDAAAADLVFRFDGAVRTVYATLVVRLAHVTAYRREEMWRNAATYRAVVGGVCGLRVRESEEGRGELTVFFDGASEETKFLFEEYVRAHLTARALPGSVRRERVFTCPRCDYRLPGDLVRRRQARGHRDMPCPDCEEVRISLLDREDRLGSADRVRDMNASADAGRDRAAATATIRGKEETQDYDVFLSYHSKDRAAVREIADRLRAAGLLPWFDTRDLPPGGRWQEELPGQIGRVRSGAVLIGAHGLGPWQRMEQEALIAEHTRRDGFRVIPVLLPGAPADVVFPGFLGQWNAVDFRLTEPDPFERLRWAITGERPPEAYLG